jgi:pyruvate formate lyase activating enzyme
MFKIRNLPPTPVEHLLRVRQEALEIGLRYVYVGNVLGTEAEHTYCPHDRTLLIKRRGYSILENNLQDGKCPTCRSVIPGVWRHDSQSAS